MSKLGIVIGIVIGLIILVVVAVNLYPVVTAASSPDQSGNASASDSISNAAALEAFENFQSQLQSTDQYCFCMLKTVRGHNADYSRYFLCAVEGEDYVIRINNGDSWFRQLYLDGEYTLVDDATETYYPDANRIEFPDTHLVEAANGKVIQIGREIVEGNPAACIKTYADGMVYAFYFNQQGTLVRFYYIYDNAEINIDFCDFVFNSDECATFSIPFSYTLSTDAPPGTD